MCGLCGVLSPVLSAVQVAAFQDLLVVSTLRGAVGAGIAAVPVNHTLPTKILKQEYLSAAELATGHEFYELTKGHYSCMMGHARLPTQGADTVAFLHPHEAEGPHGRIIGMHNGTLTKVAGKKVGKKQSDSALLIQAMADNTVQDALLETEGAYALSFLNEKSGLLGFIRNPERPLSWASVEDENALFWASEGSFLELVLRRKYSTKKVNIYNAMPWRLTMWKSRPIGKVGYVATTKMDNLEAKYKEAREAAIEGEWPAGTSNSRGTSLVPIIANDSTSLHSAHLQVTRLQTKRGSWYTYDEVREILRTGCSNCGSPHEMGDLLKKKIFWNKPDEYLCMPCIEHDPGAEAIAMAAGYIPPERQIH